MASTCVCVCVCFNSFMILNGKAFPMSLQIIFCFTWLLLWPSWHTWSWTHTCSKQSMVPTARKRASVPSPQLSSLGAFSCFRTSCFYHFLMVVCSFKNLSLSLCDLKMNHSPSLYKKRYHKTSLLPWSKEGPWQQSSVEIPSGFQQVVSKVYNRFQGILRIPLG